MSSLPARLRASCSIASAIGCTRRTAWDSLASRSSTRRRWPAPDSTGSAAMAPSASRFESSITTADQRATSGSSSSTGPILHVLGPLLAGSPSCRPQGTQQDSQIPSSLARRAPRSCGGPDRVRAQHRPTTCAPTGQTRSTGRPRAARQRLYADVRIRLGMAPHSGTSNCVWPGVSRICCEVRDSTFRGIRHDGRTPDAVCRGPLERAESRAACQSRLARNRRAIRSDRSVRRRADTSSSRSGAPLGPGSRASRTAPATHRLYRKTRIVKELLGHSTTTITERYTLGHVPAYMQVAAARFEELTTAPAPPGALRAGALWAEKGGDS